jgi:large repetitive protein
MTKARDLSDIFADANTANELVKLDGTAKLIDAVFPSVLPAIDGSNLTGVAETKPTISSISPSTIDNTQTQIVITGTNFEITPNVELISTTGAITLADTITRNSATQLTINATLVTDGTYFIRIENPNGLAVRSSTALLTVSDAPTWTTASGSLGSVSAGSAGSFTVVATSDSAVTYSYTGSLPTGFTLDPSTGVISGTESGATQETNYNFTVTATDAESQTAPRAFTITVSVGINNAGQFN